jgi:hypothetical protein
VRAHYCPICGLVQWIQKPPLLEDRLLNEFNKKYEELHREACEKCEYAKYFKEKLTEIRGDRDEER